MKPTSFFVLFNALLVCADKIDPTLFKLTRSNVVPNRFIVEVDNTAAFNRRRVLHPLDAIYHEFKSRAILVQVTKEFKMDGIFNGAALIVNNTEDVALIKNTPGVKAIRPIRIFSKPRLAKRYVPTGEDDPNIPPDKLSTHILGGVDKVHAEGNIGKGVKIGIIDSGIDYNHPFLGSNGFGPGRKIFTGYDFVGNDFNPDPDSPNSNPKPDPDPMDCDGHGTHVAGIIAAEPGNPYNISGVAYGATFGAYKIFGCTGPTSDDIIVEALIQACKDGMDILTLSVGGPDGWSSTSSAVVASRIAKSGKIVTIAAGNDGLWGSWETSSPGSGRDVISVGSVDNTIFPIQNATVHGVDHPPISYFSGIPLKVDGPLPIYATSTNTSIANDACSPLAADTPDLSKYLVVIRRGGCTFLTKLGNAAAKGAKVIFIYDNGTGFSSIDTGNYTAALIQAADGQFLVNQFAAGAPITISFPQIGASTSLPNDNGGLMSRFSSYGPSFDFEFKPAFSAPGGNIISTYPIALGSYAVLSGTSMATPFAAGGAALLLSAKGRSWSVARNARTLFETTASMIPASKSDDGGFDTLSKAGAGLINVYKAIHSTTLVSPGELILNDTAHFRGRHTIHIRNTDSVAKRYTLKHVPALTALTMKENSILPSLGPVPLVSAPSTVSISPSTFIVPGGASRRVDVRFIAPAGVDAARYPVYSGFVEVTTDDGEESYHVSYVGLGANMRDHEIFDNTKSVVPIPSPALLGRDGTVLDRATNFTFRDVDYPFFFWRLAMGTPALGVDLVDPDIQFTATVQRRGVVVPGITFTPGNRGGSYADVRVIGSLFSRDHLGRNDENPDPNASNVYYAIGFPKPRFANGSTIRNGRYRVLVRALRITGDVELEGDYDSWLSPVIGIYA